MKNIVVISVLSLIAGGIIYFSLSSFTKIDMKKENYEKDWKKVEEFQAKSLPKSALKIVESIYAKAKKNHNHPQIIKSILFKINLQSEYREDFMTESIADLKTEIALSESPDKQLLHSVLAQLYYNYFNRNRYRFSNRTETVGYDNKDIKTWDLRKIASEIKKEYLLSLEESDITQKYPVRYFDAILDTNENSEKYRPYLYDLLAFRAFNFFREDIDGLSHPAKRFELSGKAYFGKAADFVKLQAKNNDSLDFPYFAMTIMQDILRFHLDDGNGKALVDADLRRLKFVRNHSTLPDKDALYLEALRNLEKEAGSDDIRADIRYEIASFLYEQGGKYDGISPAYRWNFRDAVQICEHTIREFPGSRGAHNCGILKRRIEQTAISFEMSKVFPSRQNLLYKLHYRNFTAANIYVLPYDYQKLGNHRGPDFNMKEYVIEQISAGHYVRKSKVQLPDIKDYRGHTVEGFLPSLSVGAYLLVMTDNAHIDKADIEWQEFQVSDISYIQSEDEDKNQHYFVKERMQGTALPDVKVEMYYYHYDYRKRKAEINYNKTFVTGKNGEIIIPALPNNDRRSNYFLIFKNREDVLYSDDFYQLRNYKRSPQVHKVVKIFTDRAIYRPGQTVYFKGILMENRNGDYKILPGEKVNVRFLDANWQKISETDISTNEFGSFSGSFIAPEDVLTGNMTLKTSWGSRSVKVEEYKRPKFEISFKPLEGNYKLGQTVAVKGEVKAFAGYALQGAKVEYSVRRKVFFPYRYFCFWIPYPAGTDVEITHGTVETDENGVFKIPFEAIPDKSYSSKLKPAFNYTVSVTVTDITGEVHQEEKSVKIGSEALLLKSNLTKLNNKDKLKEIRITSTNLDGVSLPSSGKIKIYPVIEDPNVYRKRYWSAPDTGMMSREEFHKNLPYDIYGKDDDITRFAKGKIFKEFEFKIAKDSTFTIPEIDQWKPGLYYMLVESKDAFGKEVKLEQYFTLFSPRDKKTARKEVFFTYFDNTSVEVGEDLEFVVGTACKNLNLQYEILFDGKPLKREFLQLSNEQKIIRFPVKASMRGGIGVRVAAVKYNRAYEINQPVAVPWSNKKLHFDFMTFRDKLYPGQKEEWRIKISGEHKDIFSAELLAGMYDASLDEFVRNQWDFNVLKYYNAGRSYGLSNFLSKRSFGVSPQTVMNDPILQQAFDRLKYIPVIIPRNRYMMKRGGVMEMEIEAMPARSGAPPNEDVADAPAVPGVQGEESKPAPEVEKDAQKQHAGPIRIRKNFNETAFFFPELKTDKEGNVILSFTMPEALTRWRFMGLAHTRDLRFGQFEKEVITQKDLMVVPNEPRFFRQGDKMTFSAKVVSMTGKTLKGDVELRLYDAISMKDVSAEIIKTSLSQHFQLEANGSQAFEWQIEIPGEYPVLTCRIVAKSGDFSDGEEKAIPVVSNRMLVTESMPLPVNANETKEFVFEKLLNSGQHSSLKNHKLTLEFSSNPVWYAVQAIPYIMEYPHSCNEQVFSRYYANALGSHISNSHPKIKRVFDAWKNLPASKSLLSNLEKNQALKSALLEETPWVLDARNESERKKRLALLFDLNRMDYELASALRKLKQNQQPDGGWAWFQGMQTSLYITQYIVSGFGHLQALDVVHVKQNTELRPMIAKALGFMDNKMYEAYEKLKASNGFNPGDNHLTATVIQYLYARSFFNGWAKIKANHQEAYDFYVSQVEHYAVKQNRYLKAMSALILHRLGKAKTAKELLASIKEHALYSDEMGMYWRENQGGYYWYQAPVETQALLIEAFEEINQDRESVDQMRQWLLKQKQVQDWKTTRATTEAVYALLLRGTEWLTESKLPDISVGDKKLDFSNKDDIKAEAGTGYFKTSWNKEEIEPGMGKIKITNPNNHIAWGAMYWQYFEDLDKITSHETPLSLKKELFVEKNTEHGKVLVPVSKVGTLHTGDIVKVRIELRVDRSMEYVHLKDMRAAAFEPVNVLSAYHYQDGLGYYQSTKDLATHFFMDYLPKGTYVFEYALTVNQKGDFSNGISEIECMYAPEFRSHSEGVRVLVE